MSGEPIFYVYVIYRPDGRPCYIGKGKGRRFREHLSRTHNPHLAAIIKKAGGDLPTAIIESGLTEAAAFALECRLIASLGRSKNGGPLVNLTNGGDGASGRVQSPEEIAKRVAKTTGRTRTPEMRARMSAGQKRFLGANPNSFAGRTHTIEARAKIGAIHRGRSVGDAQRAKTSRALRAYIAQHGPGNKGKPWTEEQKARLRVVRAEKPREYSRGHSLSDEHKRKIGDSSRGRKDTDATRAKKRDAALARELAKRILVEGG